MSGVSYEGRCSLCGTSLAVTESEAHREGALCPSCGVNSRLRGVLLAAQRALAPPPTVPLAALAPRKDLRVLGISDHAACAAALDRAFDYTNTFFHAEPFLDICDPAGVAAFRGFDLVICSDVIEHTLCPPRVTLPALLSMLRVGGTLVLSAPTFHIQAGIEWYGGLLDYRVDRVQEGFEVHWRNLRGQQMVDHEPLFHGGPGAVLEMRVIAHAELVDIATGIGSSAEVVEFSPEWGYAWTFFRERSYLDGAGDGRIIIIRR